MIPPRPRGDYGSGNNASAIHSPSFRTVRAKRTDPESRDYRESRRFRVRASSAPRNDVSPPSDERHLAGHHGHEQPIDVERQAGHIADRVADRVGIHARLGDLAAVG